MRADMRTTRCVTSELILSVRNNRKQKITPFVPGGGLLSLLEQGSHCFVFDLIS